MRKRKPSSKISDLSRAGLMLLVLCGIHVLHPLFHGESEGHYHTGGHASPPSTEISSEERNCPFAGELFTQADSSQCHIAAKQSCPICQFFIRTVFSFNQMNSAAYCIHYPPRQNGLKRDQLLAGRTILVRHSRAPPHLRLMI